MRPSFSSQDVLALFSAYIVLFFGFFGGYAFGALFMMLFGSSACGDCVPFFFDGWRFSLFSFFVYFFSGVTLYGIAAYRKMNVSFFVCLRNAFLFCFSLSAFVFFAVLRGEGLFVDALSFSMLVWTGAFLGSASLFSFKKKISRRV